MYAEDAAKKTNQVCKEIVDVLANYDGVQLDLRQSDVSVDKSLVVHFFKVSRSARTFILLLLLYTHTQINRLRRDDGTPIRTSVPATKLYRNVATSKRIFRSHHKRDNMRIPISIFPFFFLFSPPIESFYILIIPRCQYYNDLKLESFLVNDI